jgi:hypothetical protein
MRKAASLLVAVGLTVLVSWTCAGNPGPGDPGYPFNLQGGYGGQVLLEGEAFGVNLEVRTGPGGFLEGIYQVTAPIRMDGPLTGSVAADSVSFSLEYLNPMDGCGGILDGHGTVAEGGASFSGRARVNDSCAGYLAGTFSFRRE